MWTKTVHTRIIYQESGATCSGKVPTSTVRKSVLHILAGKSVAKCVVFKIRGHNDNDCMSSLRKNVLVTAVAFTALALSERKRHEQNITSHISRSRSVSERLGPTLNFLLGPANSSQLGSARASVAHRIGSARATCLLISLSFDLKPLKTKWYEDVFSGSRYNQHLENAFCVSNSKRTETKSTWKIRYVHSTKVQILKLVYKHWHVWNSLYSSVNRTFWLSPKKTTYR